MKHRDRVLFGFPAIIACLVAIFAGMLYWQLKRFEESYMQDAKSNIAQKARLVAKIVKPMLENSDMKQAQEFCSQFNDNYLRLSLINSAGVVKADSAENAEIMENHANRPEIKTAMSGTPGTSVRYSESINQWMIYHAVPLETSHGTFVLRASVSTDHATRLIDMAKTNMLLALILGGGMVMMLTVYIFNKIRTPLLDLQDAVADIAAGALDTNINIPPTGIVHELAAGVSDMAEQLKKQLSEAMNERNEKEAILNAMSEALLLVSPNGDALKVNHAASELFHLKDNDKFNLSRSGIADIMTLAKKSFENGQGFEKELALQRSGIKLTLFTKGRIIHRRDHCYLLLTITDLTNLRKLESFRSDFIANVSHEIKTPLTCIIGAAETIQEEPEIGKEQFNKLIDMIFKQSNRLNMLVQDILSLSALERKQLDQKHEFAPVSLDTMLSNTVNMAREKAADSGVQLLVKENTPIEIEGDCQLLEQALSNLINNSIKYSGSTTIEVSLTQSGDWAELSVKDYGIGIAREHHDRIFERFYRVHKERSRASGGTGLGLAIVKHVAALHGGYAKLESAPGKGCTFSIILPVK
ncbi:MAG: hypothetical protein JXR78_13630 [Victivallales bacterium]|nr:hypothetical protein [Victivallales bacterium]